MDVLIRIKKSKDLLGENILGTDFSFDLGYLYWSRCLYLW